MQREKEEKLLTAKFLERERKERDEQERRLTEKFLEEERIREEQRQQALTKELLEKERKEIENQEKDKAQNFNKPPSATVKSAGRKEETRKRTSKPSTSEQEADKQKLFDILNEVVVNGAKPRKSPSKSKKHLRWDYEQDRKAQAIFGKINKKQGKTPCSKMSKMWDLGTQNGMPVFFMWKERAFRERLSFTEAKPTHKEKERYESRTERFKDVYLL